MKSIYKVTFSDIKGKPVDHLPITIKTKFRSLKSAFKIAKILHDENRDVVITEHNDEGMEYIWELEAGFEWFVFSDKKLI